MRTTGIRNTGLLLLPVAVLFTLCAKAQEPRPSREALAGRRAGTIRIEPSGRILSAQFQAVVYEVQAPAERLSSLDDKALSSRAATAETLLSALAQTGKARVLYQVDQPVNVFSTTTMVGSSEPVVTGTRMNVASNAINNVRYQNVGFIVRLSAQEPPKGEPSSAPMVNLAIKLSVLCSGPKDIAPGQKETVARSVSLDHSEALAMNQPRALLAISSNVFSRFQASAKGGGKVETAIAPVAYVVRYQFSPPARGSESAAAGSAPATPTATSPGSAQSTNTLTARFQAIVYEVETPTNVLPTLDAEALARVPTPELVLKALAGVGKPKVLYRIDQPVNVFSDQAQARTNKPVVMATSQGRHAAPVNSYFNHSEGVRFVLSARAPPKDAGRAGPDVMISLTLSSDAPSSAEFRLGQPATAFPTISQEHNEPLELGRPRIMLAAGSSSPAEQTKPWFYVVSYQFDPPQAR